jgi:hypothetical protein
MQAPKNSPKAGSVLQKIADDSVKGSAQTLVEELFEDYYKHRLKIYELNFFRGVFFGFGTAIGGTVMIAILIWLLSLFNQLPFVGDFVHTVTNSIQTTRQK